MILHTEYFQGLRNQNFWRVRTLKLSVSTEQTSRFRHTQQLHMNEIDLDKQHKHEKYQISESCNRSCSFFDALHFLFLALMARLSSVELT